MAEGTRINVAPGIRLRTEADDEFNSFGSFARAGEISRVWLWDIGPEKPSQPKRPIAPKGKEGEGEYDALMVEFREQLDDYADALKRHKAARAEYAEFERRFGGPYQLIMWSVDARDALANDARAVEEGRQGRLRYYIAARTRGHGHLENSGLPAGLSPGKGHSENLRREREGEELMVLAKQKDPTFGRQELRA